MAINSLHLEAFLALAQARNFTRAAKRLHVTQSALSQRILNLESDLDTTLFLRDRSGIQLTETAEDLLRYCQTKESLEAEFLARLVTKSSSDLVGIVRIAGFSSVVRSVLLPTLAPLLTEHPRLQLQIRTAEVNDLPDLLKRGEADFVVMDRKLDRHELEIIALGEEQNVLVEKKGYKGPDIYLDHDEDDQVTLSYLKLAKKKPARLERRFLDDVYGLLDGVRLGLGRAVLPRHLLKAQKEGKSDLRIINSELVLRTPVLLHFYKQPYYSKLHEILLKELQQGCGRLLES